MSYKVIVCGDRHYTDRDAIFNALVNLPQPLIVIEGGADGADMWARDVAQELGVEWVTCPANWEQYGKAAGPIRNRHMLTHQPDLVLAFHDDIEHSKGTADMVRQAMAAGIETRVVKHL